MKKIITIIGLILTISVSISGQKIAFTYDNDGNMESRYVSQLRSSSSEQEKDSTNSKYRTEIETYMTITCKSFNPYLGFEVKSKEGWTLEYGSTADSYIKPKGSTFAYAWLLKKATDPNGNYMIYTYVSSNVQALLWLDHTKKNWEI